MRHRSWVSSLVRTRKLVAEVDTSNGYERVSEIEEWLARWKDFDRQYHRAPSPHFNDLRVEGELHAYCGRPMRVGELKKLPDNSLVWVRLKEHGEDFKRMNGAYRFTRNGGNYQFPGMDFTLTDIYVPKGDSEKLSWAEDDCSLAVNHVRLTPWKGKS